MATTLIYGKNPSKIFSRTDGLISTKLGLLYGKVKFGNLGFPMGKRENSGFSETIAASDLKAGRCRQLIKFMKVCEY